MLFLTEIKRDVPRVSGCVPTRNEELTRGSYAWISLAIRCALTNVFSATPTISRQDRNAFYTTFRVILRPA